MTIVLLFIVGYFWARHTRMNPIVAGVLMMILGLCLVVITIVLGG
jgi:hypothetical protein